MFEELYFYCVGPLDGHNFDTSLSVLENKRGMPRNGFFYRVRGVGTEVREDDEMELVKYGEGKIGMKNAQRMTQAHKTN